MTEKELVDFAIEQINSHDDWVVSCCGRMLKGPRAGGTYNGVCIGQGLGPPIRGVVGDIGITDEELGKLLMNAVKDRARELQRLQITEMFEPVVETLVQLQVRFHRSGQVMVDLDEAFEADLLEYFKGGDEVFREWARHVRLKRIENEKNEAPVAKRTPRRWWSHVRSE